MDRLFRDSPILSAFLPGIGAVSGWRKFSLMRDVRYADVISHPCLIAVFRIRTRHTPQPNDIPFLFLFRFFITTAREIGDMSAAEYTALPTDAADLSIYPPDTRAPPQSAPTAANKRSFNFITFAQDWPDTPTILKRALFIILVILSGFLFLKLEHGSIGSIYGSPAPPEQDNSKLNTTLPADPNMYDGRPRTGKLNIA